MCGLRSGGTLGEIERVRGAFAKGAVTVKDLGGVGGMGLRCSTEAAF